MALVEHWCAEDDCDFSEFNNSAEPTTCPRCGSHLHTSYDEPIGSDMEPDGYDYKQEEEERREYESEEEELEQDDSED